MSSEITTLRTLKNLKSSLEKSIKIKYNITNKKKITELLNIHGLDIKNFDFLNNIDTFLNQQHLNDISIDDNSNKNEKTIEGIIQESISPAKKAIGYDYLYREMKKLYGKDESVKLIGDLLDFSLGLSDSTNIPKIYCWSLDASRLVLEGRNFGMLYSKPAKRVSSYISALCETIHQMSSHLAGALAVGSFFLDIAHLSLYKEKIDLRELKTNLYFRKYLENELQQFVHSVNHLSRNGIESPFTNISIFDRVKLKTLINEMSHYFPIDNLPINKPTGIFSEEELKDFYDNYIVDYIIELQNIFLDFFDKGDPSKNGAPYRFPVCTVNISKKFRGNKPVIMDNQFLKDICKREIYRYNIFTSEGTKVSSCCRLISDNELMNEFASFSNSFGGGGSISLGSHRVCTINFVRLAMEASSKNDFYNRLNERIENTAKILKAHKELINNLEQKGLQPFITNGYINKNRLFSTFGILGIYEASKIYKEKFGNGEDIEGSMLLYMNDKVKEYSEKYSIIGNIEQIPGESFAVRLAKSDKIIFGEDKIPYQLYSNQFIPLWEDYSIWDRLEADGKYNKLISGGSIVHITIGEKVTGKQAEKIIKKAILCGCELFALNSIYSECSHGHVIFGDFNICPTCKNKIVEKYTRVSGFFVPVSSMNKVRREWEFPRRKKVNVLDI